MMHMTQAGPGSGGMLGTPMTETFDLAAVACARWKRSVDLLWREALRRRRQTRLAAEEAARAQKRAASLRRIVRKALSEYSRIRRESA